MRSIPISLKNNLFFLFMIFIFFSCSTFQRNQSADFYRQHPLSLFYSILQRNLEIETYEAQGHLSVESPQDLFNGVARVYYRRPDSLFVEIKAGFGVTIGEMWVIGDQVWLYNIREKTLYQSKGKDVPLEDLIGISLRQSNLIEATLGLPRPPNSITSNTPFQDTIYQNIRPETIQYSVEFGKEERVYLADPQEVAFTQYNLIHPLEQDTIRCFFKQFRSFKRIKIPQHIQIVRKNRKERLSLFYSRMQINKKISKDHFQIKIPNNVEIINLSRVNDHEQEIEANFRSDPVVQ